MSGSSRSARSLALQSQVSGGQGLVRTRDHRVLRRVLDQAASIYGLDCVVSYNFKHINRAKARILTAAVNHEEGYNSVVICTAKEVLDDEQEGV